MKKVMLIMGLLFVAGITFNISEINVHASYLNKTTSFGNNLKGASTTEKGQFIYTGRVWFYPARTGVHKGWFKYVRNGRTVKYVTTGYYGKPYKQKKTVKVSATGSCTDSLVSGRKHRTVFYYGFN